VERGRTERFDFPAWLTGSHAEAFVQLFALHALHSDRAAQGGEQNDGNDHAHRLRVIEQEKQREQSGRTQHQTRLEMAPDCSNGGTHTLLRRSQHGRLAIFPHDITACEYTSCGKSRTALELS
jgi:hypothetical protein